MLSKANELSNRTYTAKKILCSMGMRFERIHAYPNDYTLYRKDYESLERCLVCKVDWYKENKDKIPAKILWYFSLIPRLNACLGTQNM